MNFNFPFLVANAKPGKDRLIVTAPWNQSEICDVAVADAKAVEIALTNAYQIFKDKDRWLNPEKRIEVLHKASEIMQSVSSWILKTLVAAVPSGMFSKP